MLYYFFIFIYNDCVGGFMIIYNKAKKNYKVAIFSEQSDILDKVKNEVEDIGFKTIIYNDVNDLKDGILKSKFKILIYLKSSNLDFNEIELHNLKLIQYDIKNLNLDALKVEVIYSLRLIEEEEKIDYEKYKLELVGNLVESISHKIQANLLVLGASQDIIKMLSEDASQNREKKDILDNLYMRNEDALDKSNVLLQLISNATNISSESIMSETEIVDTINLILDEYLKTNLKNIQITKKIREGTYICGPLNDVIFVICRIIKYLIDIKQEEIKLEITEDEEKWYFNIFNNENIDEDFLERIKKFVTYVKNVKYKYANDFLSLSIKKVK